MGKGVPAPHWETIAQKGFQLVYGSTANLFVDRHGNYIGYGPEAWELVGIPEPETFRVLPWDSRVARVWCTCFRNREDREAGEILTSDCRGNLRRIQEEFEQTDRHAPAGRNGAGDDVAQARRPTAQPRSRARPSPTATTSTSSPSSADHPQDGRVRAEARARHDPGRSRGRARPDRAQLRVRPGGADRRQPLTFRQIAKQVGRELGAFPCFMPKPFMGVSANGCHHEHLALEGRRERLPARHGRRPQAERDRPQRGRGDPRPPARPHVRHRADRQLLPPLLGPGFGRRSSPTGATRTGRPPSASSPDRFEYRSVDSAVNPYLALAGLIKVHGRRHRAQARSGPAGGGEHLRGDRGRQGGAAPR